MRMLQTWRRPCAVLALALWLSACGGGLNRSPSTTAATTPSLPDGGTVVASRTYSICPGADAQKNAVIAFFDAHEGDTIEFCEGKFDFTNGLVMTGKKGITIKGAGKDKTYLRFAQSADQDGFNLNKMTGITVQGLTIYDAPGNGLRIFRSDYVTVRDVKVGWSISDPASPYGNYNADQTTWSKNGAYAFYPVIAHHVLIEDSVSVGSSDAGVYVGQSSDILVQRTEAYHNVAGFEFENTYRAEFVDNYAHDNVGGFLIFDLPGRVQFGEKNSVHRNRSYHNNTPTFAPRGAIVAAVPAGTGALVLASDQLEFYDNDIQDNNFTGIVVVNYGLVSTTQSQTRYDYFPEGMHIYNNVFTNNGGSPPLPDPNRSSCTGPNGLPGPNDDPTCVTDNSQLIVTIAIAKNAGKSAQIIWDGGVDQDSGCTDVPVDAAGIPLTQPNPNETRDQRYETRLDERGRPNLYQFDPEPKCKYNRWKFTSTGALKKPANGLCVEKNTFVNSTPQTLLVDKYANIHFSTADPTAPMNLQPTDNTLPTDCPIVADSLLTQYVPVLGSYTPQPANDPRPSDAQLAAVCGAVKPGQPNYAALAQYQCPTLDQYGLFADPADPTRNPNGYAVPYELNTALFSDYATKHRVLFFPPDAAGKPQKAVYQDHQDCSTLNIYDCYTATLAFPVGTVIAKSFGFMKNGVEDVIETRLLIKRAKADGSVQWTGFSYEWTTDAAGKRVANLRLEGATRSVSWDYDDPDPAAVDAAGKRLHYSGSAPKYAIPSAGACLLCHGGDDREPGTAPIGPKVRNLNRDASFAGVTQNQLAYLAAKGYLDLPAGKTADTLEKLVKWNVPGSGGDTANSPADVHKRVRAFLEVNCMHCHNPGGAAQNSGLKLDSFTEPMDQRHGICKPPIAAGRGADSGDYDIQPGDAAVSILVNRVASTEAGIKMPPVARSVMQTEAVNLLSGWIKDDVAQFAKPEDNKCGSTSNGTLPSGFLPVPLMKPVEPTPAQQAPFG